MSYTLKGKLYTDNPLLDEIVYNAKLMIDGIILKDQDAADEAETADSIRLSDIFMSIKNNTQSFSMFKYTEEMIEQLSDVTEDEIAHYAIDNESIPDDYRDQLLKIASDDFISKYEEINNYYRMLNGQPDYGYPELYISDSLVDDVYKSYYDFSLPISQFSNYQIGILEQSGTLAQLKSQYPDLLYLNHLGVYKIDIYKARLASKFELLYLPDAEELVSNRFKEILERNRVIYLKRFYSLAYKFNSDYYDKVMMLMIISQSVNDLIAETPEWYIRRDIFDIRTVEYILTANGVTFFRQIPLKYQISLVRVLNKLIKYKSSSKNIYDLADIFDFKDVTVYKYYLMKKQNMNPEEDEDLTDLNNLYDLIFIRTAIDDTYDNYINDSLNITDYDTMIAEDYYWDGEDSYEYIKDEILKKDFTIQATKYLSFEVAYSISDYQFQLQYFLNLILNNSMNTSNLTLKVPSINNIVNFDIRDLFIFLYLISFNYYENPANDIIQNTNRDSIREILNIAPEDLKTIEEYIDYDGGDSVSESDIMSEGGKAYHNKPNYNNADGSNSKFVQDDSDTRLDDVESNLDVIDYEGTSSYEYINKDDLDGTDFLSRGVNIDEFLNGGYSKNSYINVDTDSDYYDTPSDYFIEDFDKRNIPELDMSNRIIGFNLEADLDYLRSVINFRHPHFRFERGYTLEDLEVYDFKIPSGDSYINIEELVEIYDNNKKIYDNFVLLMQSIETYEEYEVYKFVYEYLFTMEMKQPYFILSNDTKAETYSEYLKDKNIILYDYYKQLMNETDVELRQYYLTEYTDNIIAALDSYINNTDLLNHIYYFVPTVSWSTVLGYLSLLVNFFKSYKTQFLDIGATLNYDHIIDNKMTIYDDIRYRDIQYDKVDSINIFDTTATFNIELDKKDISYIEEKVFIYPDYEKKYYEYDGGPAKSRLFYLDTNGNSYLLVDGNPISNKFEDWDGGNVTDIDINEEVIDYNGGTSPYYRDTSFIDLNGGDRKNIENVDYFFEFIDDWDGTSNKEYKWDDNIDGGPGKTQLFYADYGEKDNTCHLPDPVQYNASAIDDYDCDGGTSYKYNVYFYKADGMRAIVSIDDEDSINCDGNEEPLTVREYLPELDGDDCNGDNSSRIDSRYYLYADGGNFKTTDELDIDGGESVDIVYVRDYNPDIDGDDCNGTDNSQIPSTRFYLESDGGSFKTINELDIDGTTSQTIET